MDKNTEKILAALSIITNKITSIENKQNELSLELKAIDNKVDNLKNSLIGDVEPNFGNIEKHIDDNYSELSSEIENHQNIIEVLSYRSIQQEAHINALNKSVRSQ